MATFASAQTGNWSATTTWVGGVVPALGDKITIATGHTVTIDTTSAVCGDDTTSGLTINGTLKFSRSVSSLLTVRGGIAFATGSPSSAMIDMGSEADPIPAGITAKFLIGDSAAPSAGKYTATPQHAQRVTAWGATKKPWTRLKGAVAVGATSCVVDDATGWSIGDRIILADTGNGSAWRGDDRTISSISGDLANGFTIGFAATAFGHLDRAVVGNVTRNVVIGSANVNGPATFQIVPTGVAADIATDLAGRVEFGYCAFENLGYAANGGFQLRGREFVNSTGPFVRTMTGVTSYTTNLSSGLCGGGFYIADQVGQFNPVPVDSLVVAANRALDAGCVRFAYTTGVNMVDSWVLSGNYGFRFDAGGLVRSTITRPGVANGGTQALFIAGNIDATIVDADIGASSNFIRFEGATKGLKFKGSRFGTGAGNGSALTAYISANRQNFVLTDVEFEDCYWPAGMFTEANVVGVLTVVDENFLLKHTKPNGENRFEWTKKRGSLFDDASTTYRGDKSIKHVLSLAGRPSIVSIPVPSASGVATTVVGYMRKNAAYGSANLPKVTLSGLGSSPATATMTDVNDQWQKFTLTTTQNSGLSGDLTLSWEGAYNGTAGATMWLDGIYFYPFTTRVRHYGYKLAEQSIVREIDPNILMSESSALARPVAVDHATQTITVTGPCTNQQVYHALIADLCKTENIDKAVHVTSADGINFTTTYTVTLSGSGSINGPYTDATGTHVIIDTPALESGTRVQIYDMTNAVELYNGTLSFSGILNLGVIYAAPATIRMRATKIGKLPLTSSGSLTETGLNFLDVQVDDSVYTSNGIDGAMVTEFAADGPNIQIDINDPDGVTSVQRLYAWMQHYQTTTAGIASSFFAAMTATDGANYVVDQSLVDLKLDNVNSAVPLRVVGGYLSRKDGSSVIAPSSYSIQMDPGKAYLAAGSVSVDPATVATAVWGAATRTLTVASGLTPTQEQTLTQIQTKIDATL